MPSPPEILALVVDAVLVVDRHGRLLFCNDSALPLLGYLRDELIGSHMIEHVHPDDRGRTLSAVWRVMSSDGAVQIFENRWRHKDGHDVPILWSSRWSEHHQVRISVGRSQEAV